MSNIEKKTVFNHLYNEECSVYVYVNPKNRDNVVIPEKFLNKKQVILQFGTYIEVPTSDARCTVQHIQGTLLFGKEKFWCSIPLSAVTAIVGGDSGLHHKWGISSEKNAPTFKVIEGGRVLTEKKTGHLRLVA